VSSRRSPGGPLARTSRGQPRLTGSRPSTVWVVPLRPILPARRPHADRGSHRPGHAHGDKDQAARHFVPLAGPSAEPVTKLQPEQGPGGDCLSLAARLARYRCESPPSRGLWPTTSASLRSSLGKPLTADFPRQGPAPAGRMGNLLIAGNGAACATSHVARSSGSAILLSCAYRLFSDIVQHHRTHVSLTRCNVNQAAPQTRLRLGPSGRGVTRETLSIDVNNGDLHQDPILGSGCLYGEN